MKWLDPLQPMRPLQPRARMLRLATPCNLSRHARQKEGREVLHYRRYACRNP
jgi:hypothetical protein